MSDLDSIKLEAHKKARAMLRQAGFSPKLISDDVKGLLVAIQMEAYFECVKLVNELVDNRLKTLDQLIAHAEKNHD